MRMKGNTMNFERITSPSHPLYPQAMDVYQISFPLHEQRESLSQEAILRNPDYHFMAICDDGVFIGVVLYWEKADYIYIEHFCIVPEMRNRQYGQEVLSRLKSKRKTLILEIDPPVDAITERRKRFYERCGFVPNAYPHIHPPYHRGNKGHALVIMSSPASISQAAYDAFYHDLCHEIMIKAFK